MAKKHSSKLSLEYRGGKIQFGLHHPTGQYRKKFKGCTLYLGADPETVLEQWLAKTELVEAELSATNKGKHNLISKGFLELTITTGIRRENLTFYSMRHTFQTQADEALDFIATKIIMGHSRNTISDNYRGKISDQRLEAVTEHVRNWLFEGAK